MTAFSHAFDTMVYDLQPVKTTHSKTVPQKDYDNFCREFVFAKLKGKRFGEAFCEKFGFSDYVLSRATDETAKYIIDRVGYIK